MKFYLVGMPVDVANIKIKRIFGINHTEITKGRKHYSIEHITALLHDDRFYQHAFAKIDDARSFIKHRKLNITETSSTPHYQNYSDYHGPKHAPFIYEMETDEQLEYKSEINLNEENYSTNNNELCIRTCKISKDYIINNCKIISAELEGKKTEINKKINEIDIMDFKVFKRKYEERYKNTFLKNPFSKMRIGLKSDTTTISQVYDFADNNPNSRTAIILKQ
jgi:hypothetical protein